MLILHDDSYHHVLLTDVVVAAFKRQCYLNEHASVILWGWAVIKLHVDFFANSNSLALGKREEHLLPVRERLIRGCAEPVIEGQLYLEPSHQPNKSIILFDYQVDCCDK